MSYRNHPELLDTTDAEVWAIEFCKLFVVKRKDVLVSGFDYDVDEIGLMIGWFANAIETGRSAGQRGER